MLLAQGDATASAPTVRDGQHDFDFGIGTWKMHVTRPQRPLTGIHELDGVRGHDGSEQDLEWARESCGTGGGRPCGASRGALLATV